MTTSSSDASDNMDIASTSEERSNPWELVSGQKRSMNGNDRDPRKVKKVSEVTLVRNRYEVLSKVREESHSNANQPIPINPPPIHINDVKNYSELIRFLHNTSGPNSFKLKSTIKGVSVYPENADAYRLLVSSLRQNGADFHTYQLPEDKSPRIVLKNLHYATPIETIKEEFKTYGYEVTNVVNVISRFKTPLPMFFIDITKSTFNEKIFDIEFLYYTKVVIEEPRKKRAIPQCIRCQQFGHTKTYCNHNPRCVRCGLGHDSTTCTKSRETAPKCANCEGDHPANYRGCITLKQLREARNPKKTHRTPKQRISTPPGLHEFPPLPQHSHPGPQTSNMQHSRKHSVRSVPKEVSGSHQQQAFSTGSHQHSGISKGSHQPTPQTDIHPVSAQLLNLVSGLNSLIQPLFSLLQELSQVTQALHSGYGY